MDKSTDEIAFRKRSLIDALRDSESDPESFEQPYDSAPDALLNRLTRVRMILGALDKQIKDFSSKIKDVIKNKSKDEDDRASKLETHFRSEYAGATLGIEFAKKKQDEVLLERQLAWRERNTRVISQLELEERYRALNRRYSSAGGDLWRSSNKKLRLENPTAIMSMQLDSNQSAASKIPELLLPLYRTSDGLDDRRKPSNWISDVIEYYSANPEYHGKVVTEYVSIGWCHATGTWYRFDQRVGCIIPFLIAANKLEELIFGSSSESVQHPVNALLLGGGVRALLESYKLVIVPADNSETPIKRWRTDLLFPSMKDYCCGYDENSNKIYFKDIDGKELSFLGERRPSPRFLYFHFIMALIRLKDRGSDGWQQIWARYYEQRPFPPANNYMRNAMIKALATYFEGADMKVVESWISDQGFDTQIQIQDNQAKELARRVHRIVDVDTTIERDDKFEELWDTYGDTDDEE
ncbi:uncharacterized protein Triagg1_4493 [Trichoderma aggressivum f. europaeum]|uniref:HNH nuclease domain-containing protein n=1 Tax=Trichoderma aggressivum f. europaeum TaxID=173218 RepID=A0AAE1JB44_9HYPO|nr:hypothetical protein Triagg1_4493 [Trichoderma aggressivum f. europaeum]